MVQGVEKLGQYLQGHEGSYVIIGGVATQLHLSTAQLPFRKTVDLDIILCVEALSEAVFVSLWKMVGDGGYQVIERGESGAIFYRFSRPEDQSFPAVIELFSRIAVDSYDEDVPGTRFTPIPNPNGADSLSAIVLSDGYYEFALDNCVDIDGIRVLTPAALVPFKARAWLDLTARRRSGGHVDSKDIKKHRGDICRLGPLLSRSAPIGLPQRIRDDVADFIEDALSGGPEPAAYGVSGITLGELAELLRSVYQIAPTDDSVLSTDR